MLPLPVELEDLYDGQGQHIGEVFAPIMEGWRLTDAHREKVAGRPIAALIWKNYSIPLPHLGLVWMMPPSCNPLGISPAVFGHLVQTLDAGAAVQLHAADQAGIDAVCAAVIPMMGGGHA